MNAINQKALRDCYKCFCKAFKIGVMTLPEYVFKDS